MGHGRSVCVYSHGSAPRSIHKTKPSLRCLVYVLGFFAALVVASLALPIQEWRTGETRIPDLHHLPAAAPNVNADRLWLEADAACGTGKRRDPDDCLAVLSLVAANHLYFVGISTVFGNAPVAQTDAVMRALAAELGRHKWRWQRRCVPVLSITSRWGLSPESLCICTTRSHASCTSDVLGIKLCQSIPRQIAIRSVRQRTTSPRPTSLHA